MLSGFQCRFKYRNAKPRLHTKTLFLLIYLSNASESGTCENALTSVFVGPHLIVIAAPGTQGSIAS